MNKVRNEYSFFARCQLLWWLVRTKIICKHARIIRFPFSLRGKKYIDLGLNLTTGRGCRIEAFAIDGDQDIKIRFGQNIQLNDCVHICAMKSVRIGDNVLMASHVYISDNSHGYYKGTSRDSNPDVPPINREYNIDPVEIGNNVWIGEGVMILPGVSIGHGAIIGAHSVVNRGVEPNSIVVGAPIRVIKKYDYSRLGWYKTDPNGFFIK